MVKVYFQTANGNQSNLVAVFASDEIYQLCIGALELSASMQNMILTESVEEQSINELN